MSTMVLMIVAYLLYYLRATSWLHYAVLPFIVGAIKSGSVLLLMTSLMILLAGVLTVILKLLNPPAPPYGISLLFRQVRIALGLTAYITKIELNETNVSVCKVYNLPPIYSRV